MNINDAYREEYLRSRFSLPTEKMVETLENSLAMTLPDSYREFLLKFNGAYFDRLVVRDNDSIAIDGLDVLYGINSTHPSGELGQHVNVFDDNVPVILLPIGYGACGVMFCMYVDFEAGRGEVIAKRPSQSDFVFFEKDIFAFFQDNVFPVDE